MFDGKKPLLSHKEIFVLDSVLDQYPSMFFKFDQILDMLRKGNTRIIVKPEFSNLTSDQVCEKLISIINNLPSENYRL